MQAGIAETIKDSHLSRFHRYEFFVCGAKADILIFLNRILSKSFLECPMFPKFILPPFKINVYE